MLDYCILFFVFVSSEHAVPPLRWCTGTVWVSRCSKGRGGGGERRETRLTPVIPTDKYIYQNKTKTRQRPLAARGHIFPKPHTHPFLKHTQVMTRDTPCSHSSRHPPHASKVSQCARGTKSCTIHPKMKHIQARAVILSDDAGPSTALALATDAPRVQRAIGETRHGPHAAQSHSKHQCACSGVGVECAVRVQRVCCDSLDGVAERSHPALLVEQNVRDGRVEVVERD